MQVLPLDCDAAFLHIHHQAWQTTTPIPTDPSGYVGEHRVEIQRSDREMEHLIFGVKVTNAQHIDLPVRIVNIVPRVIVINALPSDSMYFRQSFDKRTVSHMAERKETVPSSSKDMLSDEYSSALNQFENGP